MIRLLTVILLVSLFGCGKQRSSDLGPGQYYVEPIVAQREGIRVDINAKVDILFVIDDSGSMKDEQNRLVRNIDQFVESFAKTEIIDFHIGVTTVYDSVRYGRVNMTTQEIIEPGVVNFISRDGKTQLFDRLGHLRLLKVEQGKEDLLAAQPARFVIKAPGYLDVLKESLKVGVREYVGVSSEKEEAKGPEFEELFSPVYAAITSPRLRNEVNRGFLRDDAHFVVIFVTDANDASSFSASQMLKVLDTIKGGRDNYTVIGVINPSNSSNRCQRDPSGKPWKIEELVQGSGSGEILDLCKRNYGKDLAAIGRMVKDRTIKDVLAIPLDHVPEIDKLKVYYGDQEVPYSNDKGFTYDGRTQTIYIHKAAEWAIEPGKRITVVSEPVDRNRMTSTCLAGCGPAQ